jgi:hypothetical protein
MMKTINPLTAQRVIKAMKPRNPVLIALKSNRSPGAGAHRKGHSALRRAEKMAVAQETAQFKYGEK